MGAEDKEQVQQVQENEDAAGPQAEVFQVDVAVLESTEEGEVEDSGHDQRGHGDHQHGAVHGGGGAGEALHGMARAANQQAQSQHQEQIADDTAGKRGLDHVDVSGAEGEDSDDHLGEITHGR